MSPALIYLLVAVALIATELLIMQFSVFWFMFFGIGALITSIICWFMPDLSWTFSLTIFAVASTLVSLGLYPALKRWQTKPAPIAGNDAIGQSAKVIEAIEADKPGKVEWSGTDWAAELADNEASLAVGDTVVIRKLEGIRLFVGR